MGRAALWQKSDEIPQAHLTAAKGVLLALIAITSLLPLLFVRPEDAPTLVNVYKYLAKIGAFVGSMFMIWQVLLGFRGALASILPDQSWLVDVHTKLGIWGVPIIVLHPIFIALFYWETEQQNLFALDLDTSFSRLVLLGIALLTIVVFIYLTSAALRGKLGFYRWLYTHLSAYLVAPMLLVHSFLLGPTIQETGLRYYWWGLTALVALAYLNRLAHKLGWRSAPHRVVSARTVVKDTTEVVMHPEGRGLEVATGQFLYLRESLRSNAHPYSVSVADGETVGVTVSAMGPQSSRMQELPQGKRLLLDGGYGVFTRPAMASDRPIVMIAGGIGLTAFRVLYQKLENTRHRQGHLFYANETYADIAYREELDSLQHVTVVHVLNDEDDFEGEQGVVTADLLRRHLDGQLTDYQFLLCGPPPMVKSLREDLGEAGVSDIREELFES